VPSKKIFRAGRDAQGAAPYEITKKDKSLCRADVRGSDLFALTAVLAAVQSPLSQRSPVPVTEARTGAENLAILP
jgi:hypothetical protein